MKILIMHNYYQQRGGEDVVFEAEADLLTRNGHAVEMFCMKNEQIQTLTDKLKAGFKSAYNWSLEKDLESVIKEFKPDILHVHNFFPLISPAVFVVAEKYNIPSVMTVHNFRLICSNALLYRDGEVCEECVDQVFPVNGILRGCYRGSELQSASVAMMSGIHTLTGTWKKVARFICLNSFAKTRLLESSLQLKPEQLVVKPNFVFDEIEDNAISEAPTHRKNHFLFVGRLSEEKGIEVLIRAFESAPFKLKVIGGGPLASKIQELASRNPNVEYLGFQNRDFIRNEMRQCRALILPSIWYENFPMTLLEAFSSGCPVIASRIGGLPDIVEDGLNGLLFEPGSASDLGDKLAIMQKETDYAEYCMGARASYVDKYTPEINYKQLLNIYQVVLSC